VCRYQSNNRRVFRRLWSRHTEYAYYFAVRPPPSCGNIDTILYPTETYEMPARGRPAIGHDGPNAGSARATHKNGIQAERCGQKNRIGRCRHAFVLLTHSYAISRQHFLTGGNRGNREYRVAIIRLRFLRFLMFNFWLRPSGRAGILVGFVATFLATYPAIAATILQVRNRHASLIGLVLVGARCGSC
jgi:hypothetical protein